MKTTVYGGSGWLGKKFAEHFNASRPEIDILDERKVRVSTLERTPDVVINCAGKCGFPNIDWCEASKENRKLTYYVNELGPRILLDAVRSESDAFFVHLSSGCLWDVSDDHAPINEDEEPRPVSWYSETKAGGEARIYGMPNVLIIRLRMPIDSISHPRNLIDKLRCYKNVLSVPNSVTMVSTLLSVVNYLVRKRCTGVYNVVNGTTSGVELMQLYQRFGGALAPYNKITKEELAPMVKSGRSNCRLSTAKLESEGFMLPDFQCSLECLMRQYVENPKSWTPVGVKSS